MSRRECQPNRALKALLDRVGMSNSRLAKEVNDLAAQAELRTGYNHSSVTRWLNGDTPRGRVPILIATVIGRQIRHPVTVDEIGMGTGNRPPGLEFPRDRAEAIATTQAYWRGEDTTDRGFVAAYYTVPFQRWQTSQADELPISGQPSEEPVLRVGWQDVQRLRAFAEQARAWDASLGGDAWHRGAVTDFLRNQVAALLSVSQGDGIGRELFTIAAELSRVAGWAAVDAGHGGVGQCHLIQALRLARAGGDIETGTYVLATMALHTLLEGAPEQALDMVEGAFARGRQHGAAAPRVLAFAKLVEARAHALLRDATSAAAALTRAEKLLGKITGDRDPSWIPYVTEGRLAADACEVYRDLRNPAAALRWNAEATALSDLSGERNPRAVGLRLAVVATAACQARDLDQALAAGQQALDLLAPVASARGREHLRAVVAAMQPWSGDTRVREFSRRAAQPAVLGATKAAI